MHQTLINFLKVITLPIQIFTLAIVFIYQFLIEFSDFVIDLIEKIMKLK